MVGLPTIGGSTILIMHTQNRQTQTNTPRDHKGRPKVYYVGMEQGLLYHKNAVVVERQLVEFFNPIRSGAEFNRNLRYERMHLLLKQESPVGEKTPVTIDGYAAGLDPESYIVSTRPDSRLGWTYDDEAIWEEKLSLDRIKARCSVSTESYIRTITDTVTINILPTFHSEVTQYTQPHISGTAMYLLSESRWGAFYELPVGPVCGFDLHMDEDERSSLIQEMLSQHVGNNKVYVGMPSVRVTKDGQVTAANQKALTKTYGLRDLICCMDGAVDSCYHRMPDDSNYGYASVHRLMNLNSRMVLTELGHVG